MTQTRLFPLSKCRINKIADLAQPFCYFHMIFLVYGSQIVFHYLEPGSLGTQESVVFNASAWAMIWCYWKTCSVDPGEKGWVNKVASEIEKEEERDEKDVGESQGLEKIEWENVRWSAYPKWTTTVPGPTTASPTPPFPISSASSSTPYFPSSSSPTSSASASATSFPKVPCPPISDPQPPPSPSSS
ncbi:hypothetical protein ACHAPF_006868 [Botrytis cinerea]